MCLCEKGSGASYLCIKKYGTLDILLESNTFSFVANRHQKGIVSCKKIKIGLNLIKLYEIFVLSSGGKNQGGMDGGIRVPTLIRWPGHIQPQRVIDLPMTNMDFFPTFASLMHKPVPSDRIIDGKTILPILTGNVDRSPHEFIFHYCCNKIHAVRWMPPQGMTFHYQFHTSISWIPWLSSGEEGIQIKPFLQLPRSMLEI